MKGTIIGAIGVIIILVVGGLVLSRSAGRQELATTPTAEINNFVEEDEDASEFGTSEEALPASSPLSSPAAEGENAASPAPPNESETVIISIDESGFSPSTVTISSGTTVTFVNNGQALHWPASDIHPTHEILPEFDSRRGLTTGQTYSFTFTESGRWPMHDHLNPSATGTIIVE